MVEYMLIEETSSNNLGDYVSYGIAVRKGNVIFRAIHDISDCKNNIEEIITLCNQEQLSPLQLNEVVDNFLYDLKLI